MVLEHKLLLAISNKGKRAKNEDYIIPNDTFQTSGIFVLCDGVGGSTKGEAASKLAAESVAFYLSKKNPVLFQNKAYLNHSLKFAEEKFREYLQVYPESVGMATTIVCLEFIHKKAIGYWVGDSRLYHIRKGEILFKTKDHSLIEHLKTSEYPDLESLESSPIKNFILKAIKGTEHPTTPDYFSISILQPGDYFILLSDGILEGMDEKELVAQVLLNSKNPAQLKTLIEEACEEKSRDNYSILIIEITEK